MLAIDKEFKSLCPPLTDILSQLGRRKLNASQRAMIAARYLELIESIRETEQPHSRDFMNKEFMELSREDALRLLLKPVSFPQSWSDKKRHGLVMLVRTQVYGVYPFLSASEREQADTWLSETI